MTRRLLHRFTGDPALSAALLGALLTPSVTGQVQSPSPSVSLNFVAERSGNTFTATLNGEDVFVGLLGFASAIPGEVVTSGFLEGRMRPLANPRFVGFFNGHQIRPWDSIQQVGFGSGLSMEEVGVAPGGGTALDPMSEVRFRTGGRIFEAIAIVFRGPGNLSLRDQRNRTDTWNSRGTLGDLGAIDRVVARVIEGRVGCASLGTSAPRLGADSRPILGQVLQLRIDNPPPTAMGVGLLFGVPLTNGMPLASLGLPECLLLTLSISSTQLLALDPPVLQLPLPNDRSLIGFEGFSVQGVVLAPGFNIPGLVVTNEIRLLIGEV